MSEKIFIVKQAIVGPKKVDERNRIIPDNDEWKVFEVMMLEAGIELMDKIRPSIYVGKEIHASLVFDAASSKDEFGYETLRLIISGTVGEKEAEQEQPKEDPLPEKTYVTGKAPEKIFTLEEIRVKAPTNIVAEIKYPESWAKDAGPKVKKEVQPAPSRMRRLAAWLREYWGYGVIALLGGTASTLFLYLPYEYKTVPFALLSVVLATWAFVWSIVNYWREKLAVERDLLHAEIEALRDELRRMGKNVGGE